MSRREVVQPADPSLRTCTSCGATGDAEENFYKAKPGSMNDRTYAGYCMPCKLCSRARTAKYQRDNPKTEEQKARAAELKKRPEVLAQSRERHRAWYNKGPGRDWVRGYDAQRRADNHEELLAKSREKYKADPEFRRRIYEDQKARRATPEGRAAHNASNAKFKKSERGRLLSRLHGHIRRARKAATVCDLTDDQWVSLVDAYGGCCAYCGEIPEEMWVDHVEPISRGGAHTLGNVVPACKPCNLKKSAKPLEAALERLGVRRVTFDRWREMALLIVRRQAV